MRYVLQQQFPIFLAPGTGFVEDIFSTDGVGGWFQNYSCGIPFIVQFYFSIIITSAPFQILKVGGPLPYNGCN